MKPRVNLYKLGRLPFVKALNVQQLLFDKLKSNVVNTNNKETGSDSVFEQGDGRIKISKSDCGPDCVAARNSLILVEHEPVYTIGIRSKLYDDSYISRLKEELARNKLHADFVKTDRGGLVTFHGPGQLVAYPIIYLGDFKGIIQNRSVKSYVRLLETTIIDTLARIGLEGAHTVPEYPGVWLNSGERKVAFIGISCRRFVTMHGVSINCDCDLSWFDYIVSCGIEDRSITSIHREMLSKLGGYPSQELAAGISGDIVRGETKNTTSSIANESTSGTTSGQPNGSRLFSVGHISDVFCASFSRHFDCALIHGNTFGKE